METTRKTTPPRHRSWFWPTVLVGIGVIWLLRNLEILSAANLAVLFRLWPLLLILIGLDLLFACNNPRLGAMLGLSTVIIALALMFVGPALGWGKVDVKKASYSEPKGSATSASITLDMSLGSMTVKPLSEPANALEADISYIGTMNYTSNNAAPGAAVRDVRISQANENRFFNFFDWYPGSEDLRWDVRLAKDLPIALSINGGVSETTLDLGDLTLTGLSINGGVGKTTMTLPATKERYSVRISGGVGESNLTIKDGAALDISVNGGVGTTVVNLPKEAAVRIEATGGLGGVNVPSGFIHVSGDDNSFGNNRGVWETQDFARSERQIRISFNAGIGGLTVR